jgi:WD40 repeat protein
MSSLSSSESSSREFDLLDRLANEFAERFRRGERPSLKEYTDRYPDLADEIVSLFPALVDLEQADEVRHEAGAPAARPQDMITSVSQIGDYRIVREVGRGGMGVVYEAEQVSLGRRVALKILPQHVARDARMLERFRREARAAARLHHTNIVPVFEVGREGETCFYAMQFIQGQALDLVYDELQRVRGKGKSIADDAGASKVAGEAPEATQAASGPRPSPAVSEVVHSLLAGRFEPEQTSPQPLPDGDTTDGLTSSGPKASEKLTSDAIARGSAVLPGGTQLSTVDSRKAQYARSIARIGHQVAEGLAYAHERGVIHRDIKTSNLLLDTAGVVWITDFGLAKSNDIALTETGDILGTIRYMAPERFRGAGDERADVYALGLTLYELLTLEPAFDASDRLRLIEQVKFEEPIRPRLIDRRIPRDLETVVLKAIDKDVKGRYQGARALAEDLRRFLDDEPILARRATAAERYARWARRNPVIAILGATLTAVLVGATFASLAVATRMSILAENERFAAGAAELAYGEADSERGKAQARSTELAAKAEELRRQDAVFRVELANREVLDNNLARAEELLEACPQDLRGWEWRYVTRLGHRHRLTLFGHEQSVEAAAFSPDGTWLATVSGATFGAGAASDATSLRVWDPDSGRTRFSLAGPGGTLQGLAISPDGKKIVVGGGVVQPAQARIRMLDSSNGRELWAWNDPGPIVLDLKFSGDGKHLAVGRGQYSSRIIGSLEILDAESGARRAHLGALEGGANAVAWQPDGRRVAVAGSGVVEIWDWRLQKKQQELRGHDRWIYALAFHPDGQRLASGGWDQTVRIWDVNSGATLNVLAGHRGFATKVAFSPDGKRLASASEDRSIKLWDSDTGREVVALLGHVDPVHALAFHPLARALASGSVDGEVKLWDLAGIEPLRLPAPTVCISGLRFRRDGRRLAIVATDDVIRGPGSARTVRKVWDLTTGTLLDLPSLRNDSEGDATGAFLAGSTGPYAVSPDGRMRASQKGAEVEVVETASNRRRMTLKGHARPVNTVCFSPDGTQIATGSEDRTVKLWDAMTGRELFTIRGYPGGIICLAYSADGHRLAAGGIGAEVRIWDARPLPQELLREESSRRHVRRLFEELLFREDVINQIRQERELDDEGREHLLKMARDWPEPSYTNFNNMAWQVIHDAESSPAERALALRLMRHAFARAPDAGFLLNTFGLTLYRNGLYNEAHEILEKSLKVNVTPEGIPAALDVVFLAMTELRLGKKREALARLDELRKQQKDRVDTDLELGGFFAEAEALIELKAAP